MNSDIIRGVITNLLFVHIFIGVFSYLKSQRVISKSEEIISKSETLKKFKEWLENDYQIN